MTATGLTEKDWQTRVLDFAAWNGWRVFHVHDSRRSEPGWPDLAMVRPGRLVLAELKTSTGRLSAPQALWIADLSEVVGVEVHIWRPEDWPAVQTALINTNHERTLSK